MNASSTNQDVIDPTIGAERRAELLAATPAELLVTLADRCLDLAGNPTVTLAPEVGMVMMTVREPVEAIRFHLGEVLVCRAEVIHRGAAGWAMRMGDDRVATLAAAVLDAEAGADGPLAGDVAVMCAATASAIAEGRAREWADLAPTSVAFEELES